MENHFVKCKENMLTLEEYTMMAKKIMGEIETYQRDAASNAMRYLCFKDVCLDFLTKLNYIVKSFQWLDDVSLEIIVFKKTLDVDEEYIVHCINSVNFVECKQVSNLINKMNSEKAKKGILISAGRFSTSAIECAAEKPIELIDGELFDFLIESNKIDCKKREATLDDRNVLLEKVLSSRYDQYNSLYSNVKGDVVWKKCKRIEILLECVRNAIYDNDFRAGEEEAFLNILIDEIGTLLLLKNAKSLLGKALYVLANIMLAECNLWRNNFAETILLYKTALERLETYPKFMDHSEECFVELLYSLFSVMRLTGTEDLIDLYLNKYHGHIENWKKQYNAMFLDKYNNPNTTPEEISSYADYLGGIIDAKRQISFYGLDLRNEEDSVCLLYDRIVTKNEIFIYPSKFEYELELSADKAGIYVSACLWGNEHISHYHVQKYYITRINGCSVEEWLLECRNRVLRNF